MTDEELCKALRMRSESELCQSAADRIEALVRERDQWIESAKNAIWTDSEELKLAEADLKEAAEIIAYTKRAMRKVDFNMAVRRDAFLAQHGEGK